MCWQDRGRHLLFPVSRILLDPESRDVKGWCSTQRPSSILVCVGGTAKMSSSLFTPSHDAVLPFAQTFRAILVGGTKTVVDIAAQTDESVSAPFYLEQARRLIVESLAYETSRLGGRPWATGYSSTDIVVFVFVATFGRKPLGSVSEVVCATSPSMLSPARAMYAESVSVSQY